MREDSGPLGLDSSGKHNPQQHLSEQTEERQRLTDRLKGVGMCYAPMPIDTKPETHTEESWNWHGWQRG